MKNISNRIERIRYLDYLRVLATISVIMLHVAAQNWAVVDVNSFDWQVFNFFDSIVRWTVPVFVMISGVLFLNKEIPIKNIYLKYILRMLIAFIVWSIIYAVFSEGDIIYRITLCIQGSYHMWFVLMIMGIYVCIPIVKQIAKDDKTTRYFLLMSAILCFLIPTILTVIKDFTSGTQNAVAVMIENSFNKIEIHLILGYVFYFILGYYINKIDLSKKQRIIIYIIGLLGFVITIILSAIVTIKKQTPCTNYYTNFRINILFESLAVFIWFKYKNWNNSKIYPIILKLSKFSFGAYLVHILILNQLNKLYNINTLSFNTILSTLAITGIVSIISFLISGIIHIIPILKKYIV